MRQAFGARWSTRVMPMALQQLMRHESIETTLKYHVSRDAEATADAAWAVVEYPRIVIGRFDSRDYFAGVRVTEHDRLGTARPACATMLFAMPTHRSSTICFGAIIELFSITSTSELRLGCHMNVPRRSS